MESNNKVFKFRTKSEEDLKINSKRNEVVFLPMNFNLVLDYFNNKGKQRLNTENINNAIDIMETIIEPPQPSNNQTASNRRKSVRNPTTEDLNLFRTLITEESSQTKNEKIDLNERIIIDNLMDEFKQLFIQKRASENEDNSTKLLKKIINVDSKLETSKTISKELSRINTINANKYTSSISTHKSNMGNANIKEETQTNQNSTEEANNNNSNLFFTELIKYKLKVKNDFFNTFFRIKKSKMKEKNIIINSNL